MELKNLAFGFSDKSWGKEKRVPVTVPYPGPPLSTKVAKAVVERTARFLPAAQKDQEAIK